MAFSVIINILIMIVLGFVLLGGAGLMLARRREHGRGAMLGVAGCVVLLLGVLFSGLGALWLPRIIQELGAGSETVIVLYNLVSVLFQATGTALLIFAVVARRNPPQQPEGQWPGQPQPEWNQPPSHQPPSHQPPSHQQPPGWQTPPRPPFGDGQG
ncbi:LPXTG cell wall anchor domain-containing protein [Nonomuraea sp. NPDC050643]|uniref:LPXTG cell wall anchor domain-containing protein n=1 Tax=Nonomuraea sp. NPDC050643 TaxID=3155660 RepID=UPI0034032D3F